MRYFYIIHIHKSEGFLMSNNIDLKRTNQNEVFRYIYFQNHPVSKYDLMKNLDLSLPTVNMIIKYFTENHYLYDCGTFDSQGGRPPKAFTYNASLRHAIGLDITQHHIHIVMTDLSGSIIAKKKVPSVIYCRRYLLCPSQQCCGIHDFLYRHCKRYYSGHRHRTAGYGQFQRSKSHCTVI